MITLNYAYNELQIVLLEMLISLLNISKFSLSPYDYQRHEFFPQHTAKQPSCLETYVLMNMATVNIL